MTGTIFDLAVKAHKAYKAYKTISKIKDTGIKLLSTKKEKITKISDKHDIGSKTFKAMLDDTYDAKAKTIGDYTLDSELSGKRARVYKHKSNNTVVVAHRGTQGIHDVFTDLSLTLTGKHSKRIKYAQEIQKKANEKYGAENITSIGHSLGGYIAEEVAHEKSDIITLNKAAVFKDIGKKISNRQTDVRTTNDLVSFLSKTHTGGNKIEIDDGGKNFIEAHNTSHLEKLED